MKPKSFAWIPPLLLCSLAIAQQPLQVAAPIWSALTAQERAEVQNRHTVSVANEDRYGVIVDNQGVNESTPGTNVGSALGSTLGQTTYIDRSFKNGNYSATNQVGFAILGALIGSAIDQAPNAQFHFRYAVKLGNGEIKYFDEVQKDAFRHPVGVCVTVPTIRITDQSICSETIASFRAKHLAHLVRTDTVTVQPGPTQGPLQQSPSVPNSLPSSQRVTCKLGTLAPVTTTSEKCQLIGGSIVE